MSEFSSVDQVDVQQTGAGQNEIARGYDEKYQTPNYFQDRVWLYRHFVKALVARAELPIGATVLDAGCGQGFFTNLFAENGLNPIGIDISDVGISAARKAYGSSGAQFAIGDIRELGWQNEFDCVFTRSCSLYNSENFENENKVTDSLLGYIREGGILIFDYHSKLGQRSAEWIYHSLRSVKKHFSRYPGAEVFFSLRLETALFRRFAFSPWMSRFCSFWSHRVGGGGELVAFVRKDRRVTEAIASTVASS